VLEALLRHIPPGYQARSLNVQRRLESIPPRYGQQGGNLPKSTVSEPPYITLGFCLQLHRSSPEYSGARIESLFGAVGAKTIEGNGSRVRFELNGVVATFHRPHPDKEAKPYQVRDARAFLEQAGVTP
jgi:hypothetical protein